MWQDDKSSMCPYYFEKQVELKVGFVERPLFVLRVPSSVLAPIPPGGDYLVSREISRKIRISNEKEKRIIDGSG